MCFIKIWVYFCEFNSFFFLVATNNSIIKSTYQVNFSLWKKKTILIEKYS